MNMATRNSYYRRTEDTQKYCSAVSLALITGFLLGASIAIGVLA